MKKKILVIDDTLSFRKLVSIVLSRQYEVTTAKNGFHAFWQIQQGYIPDAIVSDLMMPQVDGKNFVRQLRSNELFRNIPVIILTSVDRNFKHTELLEAGANAYLTKPVTPSVLETRLKNLLEAKQTYLA